ncbi:hypothetical protein LTR85_001746 [Meristemomyces frigidus]|nr:hypothetical protein LTR85_001746 [Meristemomyces frigidus]
MERFNQEIDQMLTEMEKANDDFERQAEIEEHQPAKDQLCMSQAAKIQALVAEKEALKEQLKEQELAAETDGKDMFDSAYETAYQNPRTDAPNIRFPPAALTLLPAAKFYHKLGDTEKAACIWSLCLGRYGRDKMVELDEYLQRVPFADDAVADREHKVGLLIAQARQELEEHEDAAEALDMVLEVYATLESATTSEDGESAEEESVAPPAVGQPTHHSSPNASRSSSCSSRAAAIPRGTTAVEGAIFRGGFVAGSVATLTLCAAYSIGWVPHRERLVRWYLFGR